MEKPLLERIKAINWIDMDGFTMKFAEYANGFVAYAVDEHDTELASSVTMPTVDEAKNDLLAYMQQEGIRP